MKKVLFVLFVLFCCTQSRAQQIPSPSTNVSTRQLTLLPQVPLATVTTVQESPSIQGNATYYYWFVSNAGGVVSPPAGPFPVYNAPATLGGINTITVTWNPAPGVTTYDVLRTTTTTAPAGSCGCAVITGTASASLVDNIPTASLGAYTVSTSLSQIPCVMNNLSLCVSLSGGTASVINVKASPYNAPANTVKSTQIGAYQQSFNGDCPFATGACPLFTISTFTGVLPVVGQTIWLEDNSLAIQRVHQGLITQIVISGNQETLITTTSSTGQNCTPGNCTAVYGNDDTPALTAAAAAGANGGTLYFPCGGYMVTGPALVQPANFSGGYSVQGENAKCVILYPSPDMNIVGVPSNSGAVVNFTASPGTFSGITVDGTNGIFGSFVPNSLSFMNFQGARQTISDVHMSGGGLGAGGEMNRFTEQDSVVSNFSAINPAAAAGGGGVQSGDECAFVGSIDTVVSGMLCSNAQGTGSADLRIVNSNSPANGETLTFIGGIIDECGDTTAGSDGAQAACTIVTNSSQVAFYNTTMFGSGNPPNSPALSVDGTSDVVLHSSNLGPFNTECGWGVEVAVGGILNMDGTRIRANGLGCAPVPIAVNNSGTINWGNGNAVTATNGATLFSGNAPVFSAFQSGAVVAGHVAIFTGSLGGLQDGGTPNTVIQSSAVVTLSADVPLTSGTPATILTKSVTMPSSGCPCRVVVSYEAYATTNNQTFNTWVGDGTNFMASAQTTGTGTNTTGLFGSQISPVTYANSAVVTFTLTAEDNGAGGTIKAAPVQGSGTNSWMSTSVVTSQ